jgi:hypothetical protein
MLGYHHFGGRIGAAAALHLAAPGAWLHGETPWLGP